MNDRGRYEEPSTPSRRLIASTSSRPRGVPTATKRPSSARHEQVARDVDTAKRGRQTDSLRRPVTGPRSRPVFDSSAGTRHPPVIAEWHAPPKVDAQDRNGARPPTRSLLRVGLIIAALTIAAIVAVTLLATSGHGDNYPVPSATSLAGLTVPQRIVTLAQSQVGYSTNPSNSYCDKFSAYWNAGTAVCPAGERSEEWCADFAAWAWRLAGVNFTYGYQPGDLNGAAASFYEWGVDNGEWHSVSSGYVPSPGDVAVYGLSFGTQISAVHVGIVTSFPAGQAGPNVVNGDGDRTGYSVVETGTDQVLADAAHGDSALAGYVSPPG